jgi:hypothetical protein
MSLGDRCHACRQSLSEVKGPELMDREGHTYHLSCWSTVMAAAQHGRGERRHAAHAEQHLAIDHDGADDSSSASSGTTATDPAPPPGCAAASAGP